jgi:hypothetical protein
MATYTVDVKKEEFVITPKIPSVDTNDVFEFRYADSRSARTVEVLKCSHRSAELFGLAVFDVTDSHTKERPLAQTVSSSVVGDTEYVIRTEKQTAVTPAEPMTANIKVVKKF